MTDERARENGYKMGNSVVDAVEHLLGSWAMSERQGRIALAAALAAIVDHMATAEDEPTYALTDKGRKAIGA